MGFKQKGFSTHIGTSGHRSALKAAIDPPKPKMSTTSKHGQLNDAQADFKSDQEAYKKAMADKTKTKSMDTLHEEGFSPNDALKMQQDGAATGEQDAPGKFLKGAVERVKAGVKSRKEGRAERKAIRKDAKVKRKAAKKVTRAENRKIKQDNKTSKLKSRLASKQKKAETNTNEKKALQEGTNAQIAANREKKSKGKGLIQKTNDFLYGKDPDKAAVRKYKINKGLHDFNEGQNAILHGKSMKEFKGEDPRNKLKSKQNQNKTLGAKTGNASKAKTSKAAEFKTDGKYDTVEQNMAKTQAKIDKKKASKKAKATKKSLESNPLYKKNKGVKKGGGSYDKYFG